MSSCTINRALFNKAIITVASRGRYLSTALYFPLTTAMYFYNINGKTSLSQERFLLRRADKCMQVQSHKGTIGIGRHDIIKAAFDR